MRLPSEAETEVGSGHRHVVDEAETHGPITERMVAGRTGSHKRHSGGSVPELINSRDPGTGGQAGGIP
jgi:hypothetical protein